MARTDPRLGWIKDKPDHRDQIYTLKIPTTTLPGRVDLTETYKVPVVDQGDLGSCTGNGIAGALAYLEEKEGAPLIYPSRLFIYYNERVIEGTVADDAGAEIRDGIKSVVSQGFCPETDWPYDVTRFADKPSDAAYTDALKNLVQSYQRVPVDATSLMTALASGFPVVVGFTVYNSFYDHKDGAIEMPKASDYVVGGHCVLVVGYDQDTRKFKFQNSWSTRWGSGGFGTLPFDYLGDPTYGGDYWIVTADQSIAPQPIPKPSPPPTPSPKPSGGCLSILLSLLLYSD